MRVSSWQLFPQKWPRPRCLLCMPIHWGVKLLLLVQCRLNHLDWFFCAPTLVECACWICWLETPYHAYAEQGFLIEKPLHFTQGGGHCHWPFKSGAIGCCDSSR